MQPAAGTAQTETADEQIRELDDTLVVLRPFGLLHIARIGMLQPLGVPVVTARLPGTKPTQYRRF